jgi:hypothetical protein
MGYEVKLGHGLTECVRLGWATNQSSLVGLVGPWPNRASFLIFFCFINTKKKTCKHTCLEDFKQLKRGGYLKCKSLVPFIK